MKTPIILSALLAATACLCLAGDGLPRGCNEMPYIRYEAEAGTTSGGALSRTAPTFDASLTASEASNRHYIGLPSSGASVAWTLSNPADGATMRFTLPDNATGTGTQGTVDVFVNNSYRTTVNIGSYWAWTYFETTEPRNEPGARPRMRFDEIRFLIPGGIQAGDVLKITKAGIDSNECGIDFIETESIPSALTMPAGFVSVTNYGANGSDENSDSTAFSNAWTAAKNAGTGLYLPPGKYILTSQWNLGNSDGITIQGAGIWHTELFFSNKATGAGGIVTGKQTNNITISHFYMNSALNERHITAGEVANYKAITGSFGSGSSVNNLWINHFEVGLWAADYSSPVAVTTGLDFAYNRVRQVYADGINFAQGTSNSVVRQSDFRSCGDDALAIWTSSGASAPEGVNNEFRNCTIEFTYRAAAIGIFGGSGHQVHHCIIKGGTDSSGIRFTEDFPGYHFENNTGIQVYENTFDGQGTSQDLWNNTRGAIEISNAATNPSIKNLNFLDNDITNSPRHAIQIGRGGQNLSFTRTTIQNTGLDTFESPSGAAIRQYGAAGNAVFTDLVMSGIENAPNIILENSAFTLQILESQPILPTCPFEMGIGFPGYNRPASLNNHPVLVKLGTHLPGFSYATFITQDGSDLRFRDTANQELKYEIESWDPSGISYVWVRVPTFESGTEIYAAWGNEDLTNAPAYTQDGSVWSSSYAAVYHANGGTSRKDSSPNARHGTLIGNTTSAPGMIAGADVFDGNGDAVRLPSNFGLFNGNQAVTVEFWFKADAVAQDSNWQTSPTLFEARAENSWMLTFGDSQPGNSLSPRVDQVGWVTPASASNIATQQWRHYAVSYTPTGTNNWKVYLDGSMVSQGTRTGAVASATVDNQYGGSGQSGQYATTRWFDGMIDEVRISSATRDGDWLWSTANQVSSHSTFTQYQSVTGDGLLADPDGDGQATGIEIIAGTDPMDSSSRFRAWIERDISGQLVLRWSSVTGRTYRIERSVSLVGVWETIDSSIAANAPENAVNILPNGSKSFYRVVVE